MAELVEGGAIVEYWA